MNLFVAPSRKLLSTSLIPSRSKSDSISSASALPTTQPINLLEQRLWRAIDFLHIIVMFFSLYTGIIIAILRNELLEQCPLYAKLYLRGDNATSIAAETIERNTTWGNVYRCEFASFAYLSSFAVSFISLWIHIVFRRVVRTERLLRLPIGLLTLIFAVLAVFATSLVTDGVVKFCLNSEPNICTSSGKPIFNRSRWKIISLPVGGWLTTLSLLLNAIARGVQLFSKPKKSPETLKLLLGALMVNRHQNKVEKGGSSEYESQIFRPSKDKPRSHSFRRYSTDHTSHRELSPELYPYYYPPIPEIRQIKKRSRFQRICCPCFRRRRRRQQQRSFPEPYRPYIIPDEYYRRLDNLKQNGTIPTNLCQQHSMHQPVEQQTQTDIPVQRKNTDETNEKPFLGRRRSSVRFEDETSLIKPSPPPKIESIPLIKIEEVKEEKEKPKSPVLENDNNTNLQRNVSFRNNEDDLWTTITINKEQSVPIQSSHYNRLTLENLSCIDTSITNSNNGVTAIHVNSTPIQSVSSESVEKEISSPSPPPPPPPPPAPPAQCSSKTTRHRPTTHRHKPHPHPHPPPPSRSHTTSSEDDTGRRRIKPAEEINTIVADKYNYNDLSKALKSNVERLKNTFISAQEKQPLYDKPMNIRSTSSKNANNHDYSSDC